MAQRDRDDSARTDPTTGRPKAPDDARDANRDPITGAPGSHPVGTGIGAAAGGAAGMAIGAVGGPVGAAIGAGIGAVAGGLAGKGAAEAIDPTEEDAYWRTHYRTRPYVEPDRPYEDYRPAYQQGWEARARHADRPFHEVEPEMRRAWENQPRRASHLDWERARNCARDAWERLDRIQPGSADRDRQ